MIEAISKILDAIAKYAWGVFVVCLFVVLLPSHTAKLFGLETIRQNYLGFWWLGFVFSGIVWSSSALSRFSHWIVAKHTRVIKQKAVIKRLDTLDNAERQWIGYCLLKNAQTLSATQTNLTANSLVNKGILAGGSGSILDLPFHIYNFVWKYLQQHKSYFLPPKVRNDPKKVEILERFAQSVKELY